MLTRLMDNYLPVMLQFGRKPMLACPHCHNTNVHPVKLTCLPAGALAGESVAAAAGVNSEAGQSPWDQDVLIELQFQCESGHSFTYKLFCCEGETFVDRVLEPKPKGLPWQR